MRRLGVACLVLLALSGCDPWRALENAARSPTALYARESAGLLLRNHLAALTARGHLGFMPIAFQALSASFTAAGPYAPWIVSVSLPVGAIVFLALRRRLETRTAQERLEAMPSAFE